MEDIAVGVDGSAQAATALGWAGRIAARTSAQILAINAYKPPYAELSPEDHSRRLAERELELTDRWVLPAREAGATVRTVVRGGDARGTVMSVAEAQAVDLLVLGRTGAGGGPGFLHLGSVVEHAAHHTSLPLAVIPAACPSTLERIVVGVDGSSGSIAAVSWVADIAPVFGASVVAVHVHEPYMEWTPSTSPKNWRRDVEGHIEEWTEPLTEAGVPVIAVAQRDVHPADGLLGVTAARHADLLVLGTRGLGGHVGLRAGGVALKVLHRAGIPLVLVPAK